GHVDDGRTVTGADGLSIGAGDLIQTRRNDSRLGVANRQTWTVQHVADDGTIHARQTGSGRHRPRTVVLPTDYVAEYSHLAYAATAYGVQGATVAGSHTVLTGQTSAASVYVAMTRGRTVNLLHVVAEDLADAREQFVAAMGRDRADRGLDHAATAARDAVRGLVATGPASLVNAEITRLAEEAEQAERQAAKWGQIAQRFDAQHATHRAETAEAIAVLRDAEGHAAQVHAQVTAPLAVQAENDALAYLTAIARQTTTHANLAAAGRFRRRQARTEHQAATTRAQDCLERVRAVWGEPPRDAQTLTAWANEQAARQADADPRVIEANQAVRAATGAYKATRERHNHERLVLLVREYGPERARQAHIQGTHPDPHHQARHARAQAATARQQATELRALPLDQAAARIHAIRDAASKMQRSLPHPGRDLHNRPGTRSVPHLERPTLGI
ncbi:MAG: hypothetical protein LBK72_02295, partial [Bifidobacteriaceae bacterium]|nr:hypothetical protein [Bifidobacteriaceae bacterium]